MTTETHKFKKGQELHLDHIYNIQGLAGGDWWEVVDDSSDYMPEPSGEIIRITENITIKITATRRELQSSLDPTQPQPTINMPDDAKKPAASDLSAAPCSMQVEAIRVATEETLRSLKVLDGYSPTAITMAQAVFLEGFLAGQKFQSNT